jgi:hypothetical protein
MRPLNRPMFRYGGPIKEGIMQGMKDGGLANNEGPRRAALVGNPVYPKGPDGRTGHVLPAIIGGGMAIARFVPAAIRGIRAARAFAPGKLGTTARLKEFFTPAGALSPQVGRTGPMAKELLKGQTSGFKFGSLLRRNPLTLGLPAASLGAEAAAGIAKRLPDALREYGNLIVPFADPFKKSEMPEKKEGDTGELKRVDTIGAGEGTTGGSVTDDPNKAKQIQEDRIAKTKKRYYELMGIDKMKKDAAYDSLIDASRIVQEQGGDLKGAIRSGALQTQIINAISKNLDKSADIKRQIDAAILKGEIQKDIASADTTDKRFKEARTKQLEQATSATGQIAAVIADKGTILGDQTAGILRSAGIKYDDVIQDKLFNNFKKDNPGADEIDFMIAKGAGLDNGRYVIRGRLVEKKGNEVAFIV